MKVRILKQAGYVGDRFIVQQFNGRLWIAIEQFSSLENAIRYIETGILDTDDEIVYNG